MNSFNLIRKDMMIVLSDKKALAILILMPIILFSILSVALGGVFSTETAEPWAIKVGIVKEYNLTEDMARIGKIWQESSVDTEKISEFTHLIFDILDSEELAFIDYEVMDLATAKEQLAANKLSSIIVLPEGYMYDLIINMSPVFRKKIDIKIIENENKSYSSAIVENIVGQISTSQAQIMITNKVANETLNHYQVADEVVQAVLKKLEDRKTEQVDLSIKKYPIDQLRQVNSGQYYSVAMMSMFLLFGASHGAKFLLTEKKRFTLQRQVMSGISFWQVVRGKLVIIYMIVLMQIGIMIGTSILLFKVYWGKPLNVFLLTLLVAFGITGLGTIFSAISLKANSLKTVNILESGLFQLVALFGGSYFPIYLMPDWFRTISKLLINGAALDAYLKIMMDVKWTEIIPSLLSIAINGVVFLVIGFLIIRFETKKVKEVVGL